MPTVLRLPRVKKVVLRNFSLFTRESVITVDLQGNVFCLAGANGLGKSTFLLALNYAITGIVPDPERKFESIEEYYRYSIDFSSRFFDGRISQRDREASEIYLEMQVGQYEYLITRSMFAPKELRQFGLYSTEGNVRTPIGDYSQLSPDERHDSYAKSITDHMKLDSFEQLVFLQHFVFTFDERRDLLFWNGEVLERVLYLAFGVNPEKARQADLLRRDEDKAWSLARNYNWQASQVRRQIEDLEEQRGFEFPEENLQNLSEHHESLLRDRENAHNLVVQIEDGLRDIELRVAGISAEQAVLRAEYQEVFSRYIEQKSALEYNPLVIVSARDSKCGLCGAQGEHVAKAVVERMQTDICPLCGSRVDVEPVEDRSRAFGRLQEIDKLLAEAKVQLDEVLQAKGRKTSELEAARRQLGSTEKELVSLEEENRGALERLQAVRGTDKLDVVLEGYRRRMQELLRKKDREYKLRDKRRKELQDLQAELELGYVQGEEEFVPKFKQLARSFLGLDLDIRLETKRGSEPGITLLLDVNNTPRRMLHQLSESQRFFVDIALRMALAQYMVGVDGSATLFIDTPEGSLDIAYESRAGEMFARFIEDGHYIVMTANINTSQLLRRLAERCGKSRMRLHRMTAWTDLSEVQIKEGELFERTYEGIEKALAGQE